MCTIFWGSFSEREYIDKIFYGAVKIVLNLVEKIKLLFTLKCKST